MSDQKIILVVGLPCTGKSVLAESLAANLALPIFSVDPIESAIIKSGIKRSFETGFAAYLVAETLASEQLKNGLSVIIDSVSPVKESRDMWNALSTKYNAKLIVIECFLALELHKKRIEARVRNIPGLEEVTWEYVENCHKEYLPWPEERLILDSSNSSQANIKKALEYIRLHEDARGTKSTGRTNQQL